MPDRLYRAIYVSRARPNRAAPDVGAEILPTARRRNRELDVTGLLLVHDDWFVQALEGRRAAVSDLLLSIGADDRHAEMEVAVFQPIDRRLFEDWSMALARYAPEMDRLIDAVRDEGRLDPKRLEPVVLLMLLTEARRLVGEPA